MMPPGKPARKKTPWQLRLEYIESLSLDAIVDEINQERFKALLQKLAAPSAHEKARMVRLLKLYEADQLHELPTDQRANALRMRRLLIGLHRTCGPHPSCVIEIKRLASNASLTRATCERAVRDLHEGKLVIADRERERPKRFGGQGPSSYQIVWSTITDLALSQGVQATLFDQANCSNGPRVVSGLPPPGAGALPHCAGALPHCAGALPHKSRANARADVLSIHSFNPSSPSGSQPPDHSSQAPPSANLAGDRAAESQGEKEEVSNVNAGAWTEAAERLQRAGVYFSLNAVRDARRRGWSLDQVHELLTRYESKMIGDVRAWSPGLLCRHLQLAPPGAPIGVPVSEAFVRAARDRQLELERQRTIEQAAAARSARENARVDADALETEWGPVLDALSIEERNALANELFAGNRFAWKTYHANPSNKMTRGALLRGLKSRAEVQ